MHKVVIADTSCLIVLQKIELLTILKNLYNEVLIISAIAKEYSQSLPPRIEIKDPSVSARTKSILSAVDAGGASAIMLALETPQSILILDVLSARKIASQLSLNFTGTLGILTKAKLAGLIETVKPVLGKLKEINFRISDEVEKSVLKACNES